MQIDTTIQISPPSGDDWLTSFFALIRRLYENIALAFKGQISFGDGIDVDNIRGTWKTAVSAAGNFTVNHNLGYIPTGWFMVKTDAFENLKFISSTTTQITLAGQNGGANILLFII